MLAIKVPLKETNEIRKILMEKGFMDMNYKIQTDNSYGYLPLKLEIRNNEVLLKELENNEISFEIIEKNLEKIEKHAKSLSETLKGKLTTEEIENLKTSFDIIGDIVILEIPEDLQKYKDIIGKAALEFTKRKAIFMKKGVIEGIIRTRQIECIAGENNSKTIHKEHGARLSLNIADVYFSPRLATERKRVASQVKNGEKILDMFAGIGPFPILIAKDKNVEIYAVDINESAINYMEENIKINKLKGKIYPFKGDMKEIAIKFNETNTKFDRIIMNLPGTASNFLDLAISLINENGIIHYYEFNDNYEEGIKKIKSIAKKYKRDIEVINTRKVKSSRPGEWHIAIDVKIH